MPTTETCPRCHAALRLGQSCPRCNPISPRSPAPASTEPAPASPPAMSPALALAAAIAAARRRRLTPAEIAAWKRKKRPASSAKRVPGDNGIERGGRADMDAHDYSWFDSGYARKKARL